MDKFFEALIKFFEILGTDRFMSVSGWIVALVVLGVFIWRMRIWDSQKDIANDISHINKTMERIESKVDDLDELTTHLMTDSTTTNAVLAEKLGSIQLVLTSLLTSPKRGRNA